MRAFPRSAMLLAACSLALVAGCGPDDEPTGGAVQDPTATASTGTTVDPGDPGEDGTAEPTPGDSPSTPGGTPATAAPASLADSLLATGQVPGLNASWKWQDGETGPAGTDPFGVCAKADLASIGATEVVDRSFFPPVDTDDHAGQQVAEFPDTATAARAAKVLASWHDQCRSRVTGATGVKVGPVTSVPTSAGRGSWYLVSWTPKGAEEGRYHAFGTVVDGKRITVLSIDNGGQDHNYAPGKEPMTGMVRAAAAKLGRPA
ncbi:hypothetical protein [Marmoricola sp. RAF53]|uniref:hypothetical protein n=1 Tax=Marmoricola sp. RAF53 TaxID=3233059 RepID=UPI003F984CD9